MKDYKHPKRNYNKQRPVLAAAALCACLSLMPLSAQAQAVSIKAKNETVQNVLNQISSQTGVKFFYDEAVINGAKHVSINADKLSLQQVLDLISAETNLNFNKDGNTITVGRAVNTKKATSGKKVSGKVVDSKGEPMIGVSVMVKGTNKGVITDLDGNYELPNVPANSTVTFSYVGYQAIELNVSKDAAFANVVMKENSQVMDEVVVTALGIKREEKALGYSVQKISNEEVQKVAGVDVATSLTGKVSGLMVKNSTDFGDAPTLSIRGENPLIVIDGVPYANMTMRDVSADDIASISVLKGATASALYGNRGASGAVMIETKNGAQNKKPLSISLSTNTMFDAGFVAFPEKQAVYGRGKNNIYDRNSDQSWGTVMDGRILEQWDPYLKEYREYEYLPVGKDNFKNFIENAYVTNNSLSLAYKGKNSSIRSSVNWTETKGLYPNSKYDKYSFTLAGDINYKKLKLTANAAYHKQESDNIGFNGYTSYDPMYTLLIWTAADYDIRDYKNNYWTTPDVSQNFTYQSTHNNPYFDRNERVKGLNRDIFNTAVSANLDLLPWLKVSLRSGLDFYVDSENLRISQGSYVTSGNTGACDAGTWNGKDTGMFATGRESGYSMNNDLIVTAEHTFWDDFTVDGLLGGTIFYKQDESVSGTTQNGLSVPGYYSLKASVDPATVTSTTYRQQVNSIYGRLALSWKRMIFAEGTLRNDWSSTLSKESRSYLYPSVSGSFVASELLPKVTKHWLDFWKVRGSWTVSKTPPGIYSINTTYDVSNPTWGTLPGASLSTTIPGGNVKPETASTFEVGTQLNFLQNRLMLDVTYYDKLMYNFIVKGDISDATGFTNDYVNSDEQISRRGWEISLTADILRGKDWKWDASFNWSKYARYYRQLDDVYSAKDPWVKVGNRVDAYALKDYARDPEGNQIWDNGKIQFNPYTSLYGYSDPDWIWGFSTNVSYKGFTLSLSFDGRVGGLTNSMTESYLWVSGSHPDSLTPERAADVANPGSKNFLGQGVKVVSGKVTYDKYGNVLSDDRVFAPNDVPTTYSQYISDLHAGIAWGGTGRPADCYSTTFLKLREASLSYQIPVGWSKGTLESATIALVGQNLWMWAKDFTYSDPDGGVDNFNDPSVRYIGLNLKLNF